MPRPAETLNGFVDAGCTIRGELEFADSFRLDGKVEGDVRSTAELVVGDSGAVHGEISVARCFVAGQVRGTLRATEHVVLHATSKVRADIYTPALVMEDGAFFEGRVVMSDSVTPPRPEAGAAVTDTPTGSGTAPPATSGDS